MNTTEPIVFILVLTASTAIMISPAFAQSPASSSTAIPAPAVPEFTLKFGDNQAVIITIKNQPLNPSLNDASYQLFYNIQTKDHADSDWTDMFPSNSYFEQSNMEYTVIYNGDNHAAGSQVDFQVEAILENWTQVLVDDVVPSLPAASQLGNYGYYHGWIPVESSGWSNTQTITIEVSASPTPTPSVPEFSWLAILPMFLFAICVAVILKGKNKPFSIKVKHEKSLSSTFKQFRVGIR